MIFGLFRRKAEKPVAGKPRLPPGQRIYAIGDIHGRADLLERLAGEIAGDLRLQPVEAALTICLGDYVDRGPKSAGVLEMLARNCFATPAVFLRGNHEEMLAGFLQDAASLDHWRKYGGLETLNSFGVDVREAMVGRGYASVQAQFVEALPASSLAFLNDTSLSFTVGDYFFCHAGVKPGVRLDRQQSGDLLWIREEFLESTAGFGKMIVHGHTPVAKPDVRPNRINLDTGAFATGVLTCGVFEGEDVRFIST